MSGTNYRSWQAHHVGQFLITIQLDPTADARARPHHELAGMTRRLVDVMETHRLAATWAVSDPAYSAATPFILRSGLQHELAILGDANWIGPLAGRTRFARELARRVAQARGAGIRMRSLVTRDASLEGNVDLVVKQGLIAVAETGPTGSATRQIAMPRALHYGVWELPTTSALPIANGWFSSGRWATWRRIRRAAHDSATYHLVIDAPAICEQSGHAEKTVSWLMRRVATLRDRGLVSVETLQAVSSRLSAVPDAKPQQSILRRAA